MTKKKLLRYIHFVDLKKSQLIVVFFMATLGVFMSTSLYAQSSFRVEGTIKDSQNGQSLPGVNVYVKGTTVGTASDTKGHYSLTISNPNDTLTFSYIGYNDKLISVNGRHTINVCFKFSDHSGTGNGSYWLWSSEKK